MVAPREGADPSSSAPRRGPRASDTPWRRTILEAARHEFGIHGYRSATMRGIARSAGVDAKLLHYYFGRKDELFSAMIADAFESRGIPETITRSSADDPGGAAYLRTVLTALEDETLGPAFLGLIRNLGTHEESRQIFLRFITEDVLAQIAPQMPGEHSRARLTLAGSQLMGLVMVRYVLEVPPLATMSIDEVARAVGPTVDRYFEGDVDLPEAWRAPSPTTLDNHTARRRAAYVS